MPHDDLSRQFTEDLLFFFVDETRKNGHSYPSYKAETSAHMFNYPHLVDTSRGLFDTFVFDFEAKVETQ